MQMRGGADASRRSRRAARTGRTIRPLTLFLLVGTFLAACGSSTENVSSTTTTAAPLPTAPPTTPTTHAAPATTTPAANPSRSAGCGHTVATGTTTLHPTVARHRRLAIVHVPTRYRDTTPTPLVLNLHGSQSTARAQEGFSGMDATADAQTFVVAYPQGGISSGSGFEWNVPGQPLFGGGAVPAGSPDDVAFLEQLVGQLGQTYCVDRTRVDVTGFSGGARMASQLGCDASSVFAAVAPVSGLRFPRPCLSTRPVPVVSFHGTADPVDPYNGNGQAYWTYSVQTAAARWGAHNGCAEMPTTALVSGGVGRTTYGSCAANAPVVLYTVPGEGHEWPGGPKLPRRITGTLGPQSDAISANDVMWSFFTAHPLPAG
jgi:polyhydroxybutyrate depolymerase